MKLDVLEDKAPWEVKAPQVKKDPKVRLESGVAPGFEAKMARLDQQAVEDLKELLVT